LDRRKFLATLAAGILAAPRATEAQPAGKVWRIGFLTSGFREGTGSDVMLTPFLQGLRELGYSEGRNVILEIRYAEGRTERFPALAAELVSLKVDVLVATSTPGALAAKQATSTIPIVMAAVGEPVEVGLVESLAHPGGNVTGLSLIAPQLAAKRLDLLKQAVPKLPRVTVLWNSANQGMGPDSIKRRAAHTCWAWR
jgi:putative tryptophan/tyrosine transport system substrate-binding protein